MLLANGGTWSIESPYPYSREARGLMKELGIDPAALETKCVDRDVYRGLGCPAFWRRRHFPPPLEPISRVWKPPTPITCPMWRRPRRRISFRA